MRGRRRVHSLLAFTLLVPGCASSSDVVPASLAPSVDKSLTFIQLLESPDTYTGRLVVLGGEVLKARRVRDGTEIEILQLPLDDSQRPASQRMASQGRFLATDATPLDPATLPDSTPITIVGEVTGATTRRLDEGEYRYPTVAIKHLHAWERQPDADGRAGGLGIGTGF